MKSILRKDILMETYKDMQKLVFANAWDFWRVHGGDIGDLIAQANLIFIDALDDYDSSRETKLSTWVTFRIKKRLLDYMRKGNGYRPHIQIDDKFTKTFPASNNNFSVMELLDEMEQDAHIVLQLFLETPRELMVNMLNKNGNINHVQVAVRNRLKNRLRQMGWTMKRITKAFEEIKSIVSY